MAVITTLGPRIVIIGNSGSGKSTLSKALAARVGGEVIDLDRVHWQDKVGVKRGETEAKAMVAGIAAKPRWIIEGVFGWLADVALPSATSLIWLDMPWNVCRENLARRGPWPGASADEHADFLVWAKDYWRRSTPSSFSGHLALFETFSGTRHRFTTRSAIAEVMEEAISFDDV
jgi:adenylate kinase family enzyme